MKTCLIQASAIAAIALTFGGCEKENDSVSEPKAPNNPAQANAPSVEEVAAIAEEGFIYGLPIVMNYAIMNEYAVNKDSGQFKAPFNVINNEARVFTYKDTAVVTPNSDTPYSVAWLDLRAEPMVISVPEIGKDRYYSIQLVDGNTYNYGYIGSRATGNDTGSFLVVGPGWDGTKPDGIHKVFHSTTPFAMTIFRTQLFSPDDMPNVVKVQDGYQVEPLSGFLGQSPPPAAPKIDFVPASTAGIPKNFFAFLDAALEFVPETTDDKEIRSKLASIGIGPGKMRDLKDLSPEHKEALVAAMKQGEAKVKAFLETGSKEINGWKIGSLFGDRDFFKGDWLKRAAAAQGGIYGNDAVEAMYPMTRTTADGTALDGSKHNYTLTFPAGKFPPVNAFWSVTMYDGKTQLLIKNPIDRYLINSPMLPELTKNEDGSLTLYIQHESPGAAKESNWLPAPDGPIYLVMRLYWPKTEDPSILPPGAGTWDPPGVTVAKESGNP